jgi:hypothetical protein
MTTHFSRGRFLRAVFEIQFNPLLIEQTGSPMRSLPPESPPLACRYKLFSLR